MTKAELSIADRIGKLLDHLGIQQAHLAGSLPGDFAPLVIQFPERICSLVLVSAFGISPSNIAPIQSRALLIAGDSGQGAKSAKIGMAGLDQIRLHVLNYYENTGWSDVMSDRTEEITSAIVSFMNAHGGAEPLEYSGQDVSGEFLEITYRIRGTGPPLIMLPLALEPSQWEPGIPQLSQHFTTILLGGRHLGMVRLLEQRATQGYQHMISEMVYRMKLQPGDRLLDVGCGTGVHDRHIARITNQENPIVGIDYSNYMISEAKGIANSEGIENALEFRLGNATELSFPNCSFEGVFSVTVLEELDADKMIGEVVRVVKPGGRVAFIVRAVDLPWIVNAPLPDEIKRKVEAPNVMGGGVASYGCADASLYARMRHAGLSDIQMFPQFMTVSNQPNWESQARGALSTDEMVIWDEALDKARLNGTLFISQPLHCAVGTKS